MATNKWSSLQSVTKQSERLRNKLKRQKPMVHFLRRVSLKHRANGTIQKAVTVSNTKPLDLLLWMPMRNKAVKQKRGHQKLARSKMRVELETI